MSVDPTLSREQMERLSEALRRYREAFEQVERALAYEENPDMSSWVFHLEAQNLDSVRASSPLVAHAEGQRRAARAALHATVEMIALGLSGDALAASGGVAPGGIAPPGAVGDWAKGAVAQADDSDLPTEEGAVWHQALDRFIGIVQAADAAGCLYVNGAFVPLEMHHDGDEEITQVKGL